VGAAIRALAPETVTGDLLPFHAIDRGCIADHSGASWGADAHRLGKRRPRAAGFGEALNDHVPVRGAGELKRDPAVGINPLELNERRVARCPPRVSQILLGRVREGARPQDESDAARPDDESLAVILHGKSAGAVIR